MLGCKEREKIVSCNSVRLAFGLLLYSYLTQKLGIICSVYHCSDQTMTGLVFMGKFTFAQCSHHSSALSGSRWSCALCTCYNSILIQQLINFPALGKWKLYENIICVVWCGGLVKVVCRGLVASFSASRPPIPDLILGLRPPHSAIWGAADHTVILYSSVHWAVKRVKK